MSVSIAKVSVAVTVPRGKYGSYKVFHVTPCSLAHSSINALAIPIALFHLVSPVETGVTLPVALRSRAATYSLVVMV